MLGNYGASIQDLRGSRETVGLRRTFDAILHRVDRMNRFAIDLPKRTRDRRLRVETAVILQLSQRLSRLLARRDPVAGRVALSKADKVTCLLRGLRFLA